MTRTALNLSDDKTHPSGNNFLLMSSMKAKNNNFLQTRSYKVLVAKFVDVIDVHDVEQLFFILILKHADDTLHISGLHLAR